MNSVITFLLGLFSGVMLVAFIDPSEGLSTTNRNAEILAQRIGKINKEVIPCESKLVKTLSSTNNGAQSNSSTITSLSAINQAHFKFLLKQITPDGGIESQTKSDLAYLIRNSNEMFALVKSAIKDSSSYQEKSVLINLLSERNSIATVDFAIEMLQQSDGENTLLGLELMSAMHQREQFFKVNNALLDLTYTQDSHEILSEVFIQLSQNELDSSTRSRVVERFQYYLASNDPKLKVRALDGLSRVGEQATTQPIIKHYLLDANVSMKTAAIKAVFHLNTPYIDQELMNTLHDISNDGEQAESVRNIAQAVLDVHLQ